jgi:hypothetical protein
MIRAANVMKSSLVAAVALAAACATKPNTTATPNTSPEVLIDASGRVYRTTDAAATAAFDTPPDSTFRGVVRAYSELGIEPTSIDSAQRTVSRERFLLRSKFRGERLSTAFDCGNGQFGPRADDGRITADLTSHVVATATGSTVTTMIQASLTTNDGASRDPIRCVSNGRIEEQLRQQVSMQLGVPYQRDR